MAKARAGGVGTRKTRTDPSGFPRQRIDADQCFDARPAPGPPATGGKQLTRLARDHYIRLHSNGDTTNICNPDHVKATAALCRDRIALVYRQAGPRRWIATTTERWLNDREYQNVGSGPDSGVEHPPRALKEPTLRGVAGRLIERARPENWTHEVFLVAGLQREVPAMEATTVERGRGLRDSPPATR
ncbi:hypothetical protein ACH47B_38835 [Rhodococcus sp. NPDC019627]|uniref:hypothetical protein n=1 Tax=unclassified Rhodococcus (in: high G+C Gram-positive bacteria) TaxID=192944 RepID=UPI0033E8510E